MKEKKKLNQGITLIALVITIIVLLILAAVSIATLTGENGILTKATTAKDNTQKEEEKEQMRLAYATALANNSNNLEVSAEEFIQELKKLTTIENLESLAYPLTVTFTETGNKYEITEEGEIIELGKGEVIQKPEEKWETLAGQIDANNYGEYVDYGMDLNGENGTTDDWKIFYKDETNGRVFLIAADYLDYIQNENKINFTDTKLQRPYLDKGGKYSLNWNNDHLPIIDNQKEGIKKELFKATMYDVTETTHSNNSNAKCVSALLNTNNWKNFVNTTYADYAIGSPTLEMWVESWNGKGVKKGTDAYITLAASSEENGTGYKINSILFIESFTSGDSKNQTGCYDELYFPHREGVDMLKGIKDDGTQDGYAVTAYWLASPSAYSEANALMCVGLDCLSFNGNWYTNALRPVVVLTSEIKGKKEGNIWKLAE